MSIKCGNCGNYHASVQEIKICCNGWEALENSIENRDTGYFAEAFDPAQPVRSVVIYGFDPNSDANSPTFESEYAPVLETPAERDARRTAAVEEAARHKHVRELIDNSSVGRAFASKPFIPSRDLEAGFYSMDSQIYKVQANLAGTRKYAKVLLVGEIADGEFKGSWDYESAKGAIYHLRPEMKLSESEAAAFGKLYGICCICSARLTNEKSIERGIGPICAGRQGW